MKRAVLGTSINKASLTRERVDGRCPHYRRLPHRKVLHCAADPDLAVSPLHRSLMHSTCIAYSRA